MNSGRRPANYEPPVFEIDNFVPTADQLRLFDWALEHGPFALGEWIAFTHGTASR